MGKAISIDRPIRKPAPSKNQNKGRPLNTSNSETGKIPTFKFIMTLDMETVNELVKLLAPGQSLQSYIRFSIIKPWIENETA
jgi:hypothetical protein